MFTCILNHSLPFTLSYEHTMVSKKWKRKKDSIEILARKPPEKNPPKRCRKEFIGKYGWKPNAFQSIAFFQSMFCNSKSAKMRTILAVNTIILFNLITSSFCSMRRPSYKQPQMWFMSLTRKCSWDPISKFGDRMPRVCQRKMPKTNSSFRWEALQQYSLGVFSHNKGAVRRCNKRGDKKMHI